MTRDGDRETWSRRTFLKRSGGVVSSTAIATVIAPRCYAGEDNTIRVALVGCGGRGTGAVANALSAHGPMKLWAMADVLRDRLESSRAILSEMFAKQADVPVDRQFVGFDAYRKAIDAVGAGGLVILATPPVFRPIHFEYAVQKHCHVFMEKSFAVDAPGIRRILAAGEVARQKNLKVVGGLMWHHDAGREALVAKLREGVIGPIMLMRSYWLIGMLGLQAKRPGMSELEHQIRNFGNFLWTGGGALSERVIQNIDFCLWMKDAMPVSAQGQGGRHSRTAADQLFDHYFIEYVFADGARYFVEARHADGCWTSFGDYAHGPTGSVAVVDNQLFKPRVYRGQVQTRENELWRYAGPTDNPYQVEMDLLVDAIRNDRACNETERCAKASMAAIMGRMAAWSGKMVTWEAAMASELELAPGVERMTWETEAPVKAGEDGMYPVPVPGATRGL